MNQLFLYFPVFFQNILISLFNFIAYSKRYGSHYKDYKIIFFNNRSLTYVELRTEQIKKYKKFIESVNEKSTFYRRLYKSIVNVSDIKKVSELSIVDKEFLRLNIKEINTINKKQGIVSKTGGTTGKSLEVLFTKENMQERFAMLDDFRSRFGYALGKKTAWFSGKNLLNSVDIKRNRFWKTDYLYRVRYYSTFHIKENFLKFYVEDLIKYKPEYFVGFPSTMLEIAKFGVKNGYDFPANTIKAIFPTAETITVEMRSIIESFFKTKMYNQYASSEGAPFIFECVQGNLHLELQSGVFEVLDEHDQPTKSGRLIVTSFTTEGTPLIRYDIGDSISLEDENIVCSCGNNNPMVQEILGRVDDYIYSSDTGKINLGNISNTLKDTSGIVRFQVIQNELNALQILVVTDSQQYSKIIESKFLKNWRERVGTNMELTISYVDDIEVEKSGKYRMVKNNIKHLLND